MAEPYKTTILRIMGDEYPIKSDADSDYLQELAKYVEEKIQSIALKNKFPSKLKSEVLASIIITDEYFSEKKRSNEYAYHIPVYSMKYLSRIECPDEKSSGNSTPGYKPSVFFA